MGKRVTYRKKHSYFTRSNKTRVVKTPGGHSIVQYTTKKISLSICPQTAHRLNGIFVFNSVKRRKISRKEKTIHRTYGGILSHRSVREKIIRAFLVEEQNIVKRVIKLYVRDASGVVGSFNIFFLNHALRTERQ